MGSCQAGSSCPFSHSIDNVKSQNCKYFQKGNCKFGIKCALAHVLPDGSKVSNSFSQPSLPPPPKSSSSVGSIWSSSNSSQSHWTNSSFNHNTTSAIVDDSDDDGELDLVPSSLNDLLTPQELVRRRSSQSKFDRSNIYKNSTSNNYNHDSTIIEQRILDTQFIMD